MRLWAIVPVKPFSQSKSRLSTCLSAEERAALSERMLIHTLQVLSHVPELEGIVVVSRDKRAQALAARYGAHMLMERGGAGLNPALKYATRIVAAYRASAVLVLPADLPLLTRQAVEALIAPADPPPVVVLAPDQRGSGTNALLMAPPEIMDYAFGPNSLSRHKARARKSGARLEVIHLRTLALDIDLPEDLETLDGHGFPVTKDAKG